MYRPSGEIAAFDAFPLAVIRVTFKCVKGGVRFDRQIIKPAKDKPTTPINAVMAKIMIRFRGFAPAIEAALRAVALATPASVDGATLGRILVCISNEDSESCPVMG